MAAGSRRAQRALVTFTLVIEWPRRVDVSTQSSNCTVSIIVLRPLRVYTIEMAPLLHHGTMTPRVLKNNKRESLAKCPKVVFSFEGCFKGHGSMREPLEMVTVSLMQYMVRIDKKKTYFVTKLLFGMFGKVFLGLSTLRAATVGPYRSLSPPQQSQERNT